MIVAAVALESHLQIGGWNPFETRSTGAILCRRLPDSATDSADIVLHFKDEGEFFRERQRIVGFENSGRPLYMMLTATENRLDGKHNDQTYAVRFFPNEAGLRVVLLGSDYDDSVSTLMDGGRSPPPNKPLTAEEIDRARKLAVHSWERGCR
jgi:hypothetical protein